MPDPAPLRLAFARAIEQDTLERRAGLLEAATAFAVQSRKEAWEIERALNTLTLLIRELDPKGYHVPVYDNLTRVMIFAYHGQPCD